MKLVFIRRNKLTGAGGCCTRVARPRPNRAEERLPTSIDRSTHIAAAIEQALHAEMQDGPDAWRDTFLSLAAEHAVQPKEWTLLLYSLFDVIHYRQRHP